jgi:hypothetical protein
MSYFVTIPNMQRNSGTPNNMDRDLRAAITDAIKRSPLKRAAIAEALTDRLGIRVTEHMLNDFSSASKKGVRFPLVFSAALCDILDDDSIGLFGVRPRIRLLVEFAERELAGVRGQRELEILREKLLAEGSANHGRG